MKLRLEITGKTTDGKMVVGGCFKQFTEQGMPLPILFTLMSTQNMVPDFVDFYKEAQKNGWTYETIRSRLEEAVLDGYDPAFWEGVEQRLKLYHHNN